MSDNGMLAFQLDDLRAKFAEGITRAGCFMPAVCTNEVQCQTGLDVGKRAYQGYMLT